jgi:predicted phage baseplate assembly protein
LNLNLKLANPLAAEGGLAGETLAHASGRAIELREARLRAVALGDYESLALDAPGTRVARAVALANLCPGMDCFAAPGVITVIVVPAMPGATPLPSAGLLGAIQARLDSRRVIGTRVMVVGPRYLEVAVRARVKAFPKAAKARVRDQVAAAIDAFFNPITGGPGGTGWPFGRDVYRSEILQVIDETPGVDHVLSLELSVEGCPPQCGNLCLRPTWLVAAGRHEIEVV